MEVLGFFLTETGIGVCEVRPDGRLRERASIPLKREGRAERLFAVDPKGKWLCIAPGFDEDGDGWTLEDRPFGPKRKQTRLTFYRIDSSGAPRSPVRFSVPGIGLQLVPCPTGRRLFVNGGTRIVSVGVSERGKPRLDAVRNNTGSFSFKSGGGERDATQLTVSADGKWAFAFDGDGFSDHAENYLQVYKIGGNGALSPVGPRRFNNGAAMEAAGPAELMADGTTALARVGPWTDDCQSLCFRNGQLTSGTKLDPRMRSWQLDPRGRFVYALCAETLLVYRRAAPGKLNRVAAYREINGPLALEPLGRFAYDPVKTWTVLPDGRLRFLHKRSSPIVPQDLRFAVRGAG